MGASLLGVVLVVLAVVLIVHALGVLLGVVLSLLFVEVVLALGLGELVNLLQVVSIGLVNYHRRGQQRTSAPAKPARSSLANW